MLRPALPVLALGFVLYLPTNAFAVSSKLQVEVFSGTAANVNSFVFHDSVGSLIVDATRNSQDAAEVAKIAKKYGDSPKQILITHGHPDHYLGLGVLRRDFPSAEIVVATQQIKDDIISFAKTAAQNHWLGDEPLMRPISESDPKGFDYQREIHILRGKTLALPGGAQLEVISDFPHTEAENETLLYSHELKALFTSDLVYSGVHLWMGRGVDAKAVTNWKRAIASLRESYSQLGLRIFPGHGKPTDAQVFDTDLKYMNDLLSVVRAAKSPLEAQKMMMDRYPGWEGSDFILAQSIKNQFRLIGK